MNRSPMICVGLLLAMFSAQPLAAGQGTVQKTYSEKQLAQQQRMTDCSAEAKASAMKGAARMAFMKSCLSGGSVTVMVGEETASAPDEARATPSERMKICGAEAGAQALEGEARQQFMATCLAN